MILLTEALDNLFKDLLEEFDDETPDFNNTENIDIASAEEEQAPMTAEEYEEKQALYNKYKEIYKNYNEINILGIDSDLISKRIRNKYAKLKDKINDLDQKRDDLMSANPNLNDELEVISDDIANSYEALVKKIDKIELDLARYLDKFGYRLSRLFKSPEEVYGLITNNYKFKTPVYYVYGSKYYKADYITKDYIFDSIIKVAQDTMPNKYWEAEHKIADDNGNITFMVGSKSFTRPALVVDMERANNTNGDDWFVKKKLWYRISDLEFIDTNTNNEYRLTGAHYSYNKYANKDDIMITLSGINETYDKVIWPLDVVCYYLDSGRLKLDSCEPYEHYFTKLSDMYPANYKPAPKYPSLASLEADTQIDAYIADLQNQVAKLDELANYSQTSAYAKYNDIANLSIEISSTAKDLRDIRTKYYVTKQELKAKIDSLKKELELADKYFKSIKASGKATVKGIEADTSAVSKEFESISSDDKAKFLGWLCKHLTGLQIYAMPGGNSEEQAKALKLVGYNTTTKRPNTTDRDALAGTIFLNTNAIPSTVQMVLDKLTNYKTFMGTTRTSKGEVRNKRLNSLQLTLFLL